MREKVALNRQSLSWEMNQDSFELRHISLQVMLFIGHAVSIDIVVDTYRRVIVYIQLGVTLYSEKIV
jgi:hypothetical protein